MGSAILQVGRFADAQESRIHVAKRSVMCSFVMKVLRNPESQKSHFQGWKCSYMSSAALQSSRIADCQE